MTPGKRIRVPVNAGVIIGVSLSVMVGLIYFAILHEPGSAFYPFAVLVFAVNPVIGGIIARARMPQKRLRVFLTTCATIFAIGLSLFFIIYAVLPQFARTSIRLPAFCDGFNETYIPPADLVYTLPDIGDGIRLASDGESAVVAIIDTTRPTHPSDVFLVKELDQQVILNLRFGNDIISAAITDGTLILFNDKLGFLIDARTGELEENFLIMDNYGGLSESDRPIISGISDGHWYMETTGIFSNWRVDGSVFSRRHVTFNSTGRGCFIVGETQEVIELSP